MAADIADGGVAGAGGLGIEVHVVGGAWGGGEGHGKGGGAPLAGGAGQGKGAVGDAVRINDCAHSPGKGICIFSGGEMPIERDGLCGNVVKGQGDGGAVSRERGGGDLPAGDVGAAGVPRISSIAAGAVGAKGA